MANTRKRMASVRARRRTHVASMEDEHHGTRWETTPYWDKSMDEALARAIRFWGEGDHHRLAALMAEVLFGSGSGRPKGPKDWTPAKYLRLGFAYEALKYKHPDMSDTQIAALLSESPDFKVYDSEILRQRLAGAKRELKDYYDYCEDYACSMAEDEGR